MIMKTPPNSIIGFVSHHCGVHQEACRHHNSHTFVLQTMSSSILSAQLLTSEGGWGDLILNNAVEMMKATVEKEIPRWH